MELSYSEDDGGRQLWERARVFFNQDDYIGALEFIEDLSFFKGSNESCVNELQGVIFMNIAGRTENPDVKFTYWLGSVESFSRSIEFLTYGAASSLFHLAELTGLVLYYKESRTIAKEALFGIHYAKQELDGDEEETLKYVIKTSDSKIAEYKTHFGSSVEICEQKVSESKGNEERRKSDSDFVKGLRSYWAGLNVENKRNFMKVSIADLTNYVEGLHGSKGRYALEQVLTSAREDKKWRFWMCRTCSKKFSTPEECKSHLVKEHTADEELKPLLTKAMPQRISKSWARKILVGGWEPVDAVTAVEMIKYLPEDVKAFAYENGWSRNWPVAVDEERSKLLQEIHSLLVSLCDCKTLSCSVRDWVISIVVKHLETLEVSKHTLNDCHLLETPQCICFLECGELNQILYFLKYVKCERDYGTHLVCRAVDSFCNGTEVKEKIDFDPQFLFLLLDKRLLQGKIVRYDDEGRINFLDPDVHYAKAHAHGDDILSWLIDHSSRADSFQFPKPIRTHNFDIWVAVLRALQFMCRNLETKCDEKLMLLDYDAALTDAKKLCICEDEKRRNLQEDQWNRYASLLSDICEEKYPGNTISTILFLNAVRDVLKEALNPTLEDPNNLGDSLNVIRESKNVSDDIVLKSINRLKFAVTSKVPLIDSKILLIENSRIDMLNDLTRLSVLDYRSYILRPLKGFLLDGIVDMKNKANLAAAEANLLLVDEKKSQSKKQNKSNKEELDGIVDMDAKATLAAAQVELLSEKKQEKQTKSEKKKKNRNKKRTSTSRSIPDQNLKHESSFHLEPGVTSPSLKTAEEDSSLLDKTVEHEHCVSLEPEGPSPSRKTAEEDSLEPENTLSSERGRLGILSNTDNQEEAATDKQNMSGEDSLLKPLESSHGAATSRCNSALDMTLKALCNIKVLKEYLIHNRHQFPDSQEEQVRFALQNFLSAFVSEEIKEERLYSYLLGNLYASLEEVQYMSSDAAELLVSILEFWPCWKSPQIQSFVTRILTLEEYERMSCRKCRRKSNYPEQSSYGVVIAADSIRDLKCAFKTIMFEDILKVIRMEDRMLCDVKTGGCGKENFVHHIISRCPPIFIIVLEWEKNETEKEISETTKALDWEIDISKLYDGLEEPSTKYRLVSMVGCAEEKEYICLAYEMNRWVSFRHEGLGKEVVGNWKNVVRFCGARKIRPEILFYEAFQWNPIH